MKRKENPEAFSAAFKIPKPNISSTNDLMKLTHDDVLEILREQLRFDEQAVGCVKKEQNQQKQYPLNALNGNHLLAAIDGYEDEYSRKQDKVTSKQAMISSLMEEGKIAIKSIAESIAIWLIKKFVVDHSRSEYSPEEAFLKRLLEDNSLKPEDVYSKCLEFVIPDVDVPSVPLPNNKSDYDEFINVHLNNITDAVKLEMPSENEMKDYFGGDYYLRTLPCYHGKLRKHVLPWIPSLQLENGQKLERSKKVACAISPSGMGKTAFMARCLTKMPGLLVTGSASFETDTGETTDTSVALFHGLLSSLGICKKYAAIRQGIQLIFISHLIHIINAIHNAKQDKSLLDPFEGSLCAYIGYIQSNGNTSRIGSTFNDLKQYFYSDIYSLRNITVHLIEKVCELTQSKFIICVDEANVFESEFGKYVSPNGNTRGFLSIIASEVSILMKMTSLFTNVIYAGTNFSIDISKVVHSAIGKTESISSIQYLMDFDYFDLEQFISFLKKHITLPNSDENNIRTWINRFPIRRRHASLVLEEMQNCKEDKLEQGFVKAKQIMQIAIEKKIRQYAKLIETRSEAIQADYLAETFNDVLFRYIIHYEYPGLLGHQFKVKNKTIANNILSSGLTAPKTITDGNYLASFCKRQSYLENCIWVDMVNNGETFFGKTIHKELEQFMKNVLN